MDQRDGLLFFPYGIAKIPQHRMETTGEKNGRHQQEQETEEGIFSEQIHQLHTRSGQRYGFFPAAYFPDGML